MPVSRGRSDEGAVLRCCNRLRVIPCASFCLFLLLYVCVIVCLMSVVMGTYRGQHMLLMQEEYSQFLPVWLGVTLGTLVMGAVYLLLSTYSSYLASRAEYRQRSRTALKVAYVAVVSTFILLQCLWLLVVVIVGAVVLFMKHLQLAANNKGCVWLANYGLPVIRPRMCQEELSDFNIQVQEADLPLCYGIGFISAAAVVPCLTIMIISMWTNMTNGYRGYSGYGGSPSNDNNYPMGSLQAKRSSGNHGDDYIMESATTL